MHGGAERHGGGRRRPNRAVAALLAAAAALAIAGCSDPGSGAGSSSGPSIVTGEQVVTACFQSYFYNGILPKASAQANCKSCVVDELRKLGVDPTSGENVADMLTGDRLSSVDIRSLQNGCNEPDANAQ